MKLTKLDTGMTLPTPEELERGMRIGCRERAEMAQILKRSAVEVISSTWRARKNVADVCGTRPRKGLASHFPAWI